MSVQHWPNRVTIARLMLVAPFIFCLLRVHDGTTGWRWASLILFVAMALGDALDGFLARRFAASTPLGRFLDPLGDKLLIASAMILLSLPVAAVPGFRLPMWVPIIAVGKDVLTVAGYLLLRSIRGRIPVQPRILGKLCTAVQLTLIGLTLSAPDWAEVAVVIVPVFWSLASAAALAAFADYVVAAMCGASDSAKVVQ